MHLLEQAIADAITGSPEIKPGTFVSARFEFKKDFIGFSGHFPGYPLLPAFVQLACASALIRQATDPSLIPAILEKAKFLTEIHPGDIIRMECTRLEESKVNKWRVTVYAGDAPAAGFLLTLQKEETSDA